MIGHADVCVVGGGPAGACMAAKLAQLGYLVAVIEQHRLLRERVGESLSRGAWRLLESIGIAPRALRTVGCPVDSAIVQWTSAGADPAPHGTWTIDRGRFDELLLEHARQSGAVIHHGRALRPRRAASGWQVQVGEEILEARHLVDATGRSALLRGSRVVTAPRTVAVHARWPSSHTSLPDTLVCALPNGWLWCARLPGGDVRAMAFTDPPVLAAGKGMPGNVFRRLLASSKLSSEVLRALPADVPVSVCDAGSYQFDEVITTDCIRVGEAAFALDPLSSSGIQMAVQTGLAAAAAVHTVLSPDGDRAAALEYYRDLVVSTVTHHQAATARAYAQHTAYAHHEFWRRRRSTAEPVAAQPLSVGVGIESFLPRRVRLRDTAHLRAVPCRVGERIERRRALCTPHLDRPAAFLGGTALAPVIDVIESAPTLAAALSQLPDSVPVHHGYRILAWLADQRLLEIVDT